MRLRIRRWPTDDKILEDGIHGDAAMDYVAIW